jgi:hypothetical protein
MNLAKSGTWNPLGYGTVSKTSGYGLWYVLTLPLGSIPNSLKVQATCSLTFSDIPRYAPPVGGGMIGGLG